jgi:hypothetical protein
LTRSAVGLIVGQSLVECLPDLAARLPGDQVPIGQRLAGSGGFGPLDERSREPPVAGEREPLARRSAN